MDEAFRRAPVGMLVVELRGAIVEANPQAELIFGYSRAELLSQPIGRLIQGFEQALRAFLDRPASQLGRETYDLVGQHRTGLKLLVQVGFGHSADDDGSPVLVSVVDLTALRHTSEQFRLAIEAAPIAILMVDESGTVILVNAQLEKVFGYSRDELVGGSVERLLPERARKDHVSFRAGFASSPVARPMGAGRELFGLRKDGREVPVEIGLSPFRTEKGMRVLASIVDITERREFRQSLQRALAETEVLLKELHHRAKNNLQLIAALLDLASSSRSPQAIAETRDRINSIALVHEKLYEAGTMSRVEMGDYLRTLAQQVSQSWNPVTAGRVRLTVKSDEVWLPLERSVPCGLIINELLTNAFKHAFPSGRGGQIVVSASSIKGRVELSVEDDGIGIPPEAVRPTDRIGLDLVRALSRQLHADLRFQAAHGTRVSLAFDESAP